MNKEFLIKLKHKKQSTARSMGRQHRTNILFKCAWTGLGKPKLT